MEKNGTVSSDPKNSAIVNFFEGRSIFITGATGFVGKAVIEKLLRVCPTVAAIYILLRPNRRSDITKRMEHFWDDFIFENVKKDNPTNILKVIPISGDISMPKLGISDEDQILLSKQVSVVIHSAATINFNGKLRDSYELNVNGTKGVIQLCKEMDNLVAFIHISTAYANCDQRVVNEFVYPMSKDSKELEQLLAEMSDAAVEVVTPKLLENKPNTYVYTKAMAETVVCEESQALPTCIIRPSIVSTTWKEPFSGWIDAESGLAAIPTAWGRGVFRTWVARGENVIDLIPVDTLVNLILAAAWETGTSKIKSLRVYNCCSGGPNPLSFDFLRRVGNRFVVKNPVADVLWYPHMNYCSNIFLSKIADSLQLYLPALAVDLRCLLLGRERKALNMYSAFKRLRSAVQYFTLNQWLFRTNNMTELNSNMSPRDQVLFNFQIQDLNWKEYLESSFQGVMKHVLKDEDSTKTRSRARVRKLYWLHRFTQFLLVIPLIALARCFTY